MVQVPDPIANLYYIYYDDFGETISFNWLQNDDMLFGRIYKGIKCDLSETKIKS